jgi:phage terminase small subunit
LVGLNSKHAAFEREYLVDLNATQAAIRAGYSKKTAGSQGQRLLKNVEIKARIDAALLKRAARVEVTADDVLRELKRIAFADPSKVLGENGYLLTMNEMPEDVRRTISSVDLSGDGGTKIKFWDKTKGLELLGKHLKLFTDKTELTGKDGGPLKVSFNINRTVKG